MIASPCTGVCVIDPATALCGGCLRTLDEIAGWGAASDNGRRAVLARVAARRMACTPPPGAERDAADA